MISVHNIFPLTLSSLRSNPFQHLLVWFIKLGASVSSMRVKKTVYSSRFLGTDPIGPLLAKLSVPAMAGMIVNALYNFEVMRDPMVLR